MSENKEPDYGNGKICYIEIPTDDIQASSEFYQSVFGWNVRTRGDGSTAFDDGVGQISGTWKLNRKPSVSPSLTIFIMVDSVEETMKKIADKGGKIIRPIGSDAPEITAYFSDPYGNELGLYQNP